MNTLYPVALAVSLASTMTAAQGNDIVSQFRAQAEGITQEYISTLKPQLKNAIQAGGFEHAVNVCSVEAPKIAANLSERTGWDIRRVSLKPRNTANARPDNLENTLLKQFAEEVANNGENPKLVHYEVVGNEFRYLKAQRVEGICLGCHGQSLTEAVSNTIDRLYPGDTATGYVTGQVRGAISLRVELPN